MADLPQELIREVQKHTGRPWWNGQAYADSVGYHALAVLTYRSALAIGKTIEQLRAMQAYEQSDALRKIAAEMKARAAVLIAPDVRAKLDAE